MDTEPAPPPIVNEDAVRQASLESLLIFLDNNDASCPMCGYSLRGIRSTNCPECGWVITLRPSDGIDRQRVIQSTLWLAYMGLLISIPALLSLALTWLMVGTIAMLSSWAWMIYGVGQLTLLVLCLYTNLVLRNYWRGLATNILLRRTRRLSRIILWTTASTYSAVLITQVVSMLS